MIGRYPMFPALSGARQRLPTIVQPQMPTFQMPKPPTGTYTVKPATMGKLMTTVAKAKQPDPVAAVAKGQPPVLDAAKAQAEADAKKKRQTAARLGILRNQATNKPPVLSAPGTASAAMPSTLPSATRTAMASNTIV